jgi:hypothetical protein
MTDTKKYSHIHKIWQADIDAVRVDMIAMGENPDAKPPGKCIKPYAIQEGNKFRLPTINMLDKHFRCWWWNSIDMYWKYEFRIMIGTPALDENDYIIEPYEKLGFDTDSQSWLYNNSSALRLIDKGITHFIPYIPNCPPLILCNPLDNDLMKKLN